MILLQAKERQTLEGFGRVIPISCLVRNELNGTRGMTEVVYSENEDGSKGVPYMPRPFPVGTWTMYKAEQVFNNPSLGPWFFPTDAWQLVDEWSVIDGSYKEPTGRKVKDYGYGVHVSYRLVNGELVAEVTSDGCLHIQDSTASTPGGGMTPMTKEEALDWLVNEVANFYAAAGFQGDKVELVVTEPGS